MNNQKGDLYLIPNLLGGGNPDQYLGKELFSIIQKLTHFIVENEKNARRYLIKLGIPTPIDDLNFFILNKWHSSSTTIKNNERNENLARNIRLNRA